MGMFDWRLNMSVKHGRLGANLNSEQQEGVLGLLFFPTSKFVKHFSDFFKPDVPYVPVEVG